LRDGTQPAGLTPFVFANVNSDKGVTAAAGDLGALGNIDRWSTVQ
jgi:hypothetical protein